jgi:Domain of unknown function (DUF4296)
MFRDQVKFPFERKMRRIILFGILILLISACGKPKKPEDILSEKQMVNALTELYLAEEKANRMASTYDSTKKIFSLFSDKAFEKAGVSDSVFRKSLDYYMTDPEKLEKIYSTLIDSLNLKAQRVDAQKKEKDAAPE